MKSKVILSGTLLVLLSSSVVWAGDPWKEKPYTEWTAKDVDKVLQNSPWAKQFKVHRSGGFQGRDVDDDDPRDYKRRMDAIGPHGSPSIGPQGTTVPSGTLESRVPAVKITRFSVWWGSSLTIREALLRRLQMNLSSRLPSQEQVEKGPPKAEHYVIFLEANEGLWFQTEELKGRSIEEFLRDNTYLQPKHSREKVPPLRVERFQIAGLSGTHVLFFFPRKVNGKLTIRPDEKNVKFQCKLRWKRKVDVTFDLRKMVRDGKPDL